MSLKPGCPGSILLRFLINAAAIYIAALAIPGIHLDGWKAILFVTLIFGAVNALIKPLVQMVTCFIQVLTLGLFTLVINGAMLYLTAWLAGLFHLAFSVDSFLAAFLGALVASVVSFVLSRVFK